MPVVEEQLRAGVREVEGGGARIVKSVTTEQQSIDVPVQREEVYVTERGVNRPATEADLAAMDRDIEIPLREQEVVTSKQAVVTGEVGIRKETVTDTQRVSDRVRREEVHVEDGNTPRVHVKGSEHGAADAVRDDEQVDRARYGRFTEAERRQYDAMRPEQQRAWAAEYDRRNPIEKVADAITGKNTRAPLNLALCISSLLIARDASRASLFVYLCGLQTQDACVLAATLHLPDAGPLCRDAPLAHYGQAGKLQGETRAVPAIVMR